MADLVERVIDVAVKLSAAVGSNQPNNFAESGGDQVTLSGHRVSARIQNSGSAAGSHATISVWGMSQSLMDQLSTLGMVIQMVPRNTITVTAGDRTGGMSTVFIGTILDAYGDYNSAPDVPFRFECLAGAAEQAIPYPVSSFTGATDVATVMSAIASKMNWGFENNGVSVKLASPYFSGSAMQQVRTIAEHARINAAVVNNVLAIWPRYGNRKGGTPLVAPPPTGQMIGYPSYTQQGIMLKNIFDPRIIMGGQIQLQSSLTKASGLWNVLKLDHALDALMPKGQWMSTIYAYNPRFPAPIPPQT